MAQNSSATDIDEDDQDDEAREEEIIDAGDAPVRDETGRDDHGQIQEQTQTEKNFENQTEIENASKEKNTVPPAVLEPADAESLKNPLIPWKLRKQKNEEYSFKLKLFAGVTASRSTYQEALPFKYDSVKLPAWSVEAELRAGSFLLTGDFKSLPAKVHSDQGNLNFYGWRYRHMWGSVGGGVLVGDTHHFYIKGMAHYTPTLFPIQVGVFQSEAALEKVLLFGLGFGYKTDFLFYQWPFTVQMDVFYLGMSDPGYDLRYGAAWNFRLTRFHEWRNIRLGLSYDQVGQVLSMTELYTGQDYSFKSFVRLHQLLLHVEVPLL